MANLEKIVKLTQSQYDTLANGGTVNSTTGLNNNGLYLVPDNGGGEFVADVTATFNFDNWYPTLDVSTLIGKRLLIGFYNADTNEYLGYTIIPVCSQYNHFSFPFFLESNTKFGLMYGHFDIMNAPAAPFGHYIGGGCGVGVCGSDTTFPSTSDKNTINGTLENLGITAKVYMQNV